MENWNPSVISEIVLSEHAGRVERTGREGWRRHARRDRTARERLAKLLLAWAARLTPTLCPPRTTRLEIDSGACCAP